MLSEEKDASSSRRYYVSSVKNTLEDEEKPVNGETLEMNVIKRPLLEALPSYIPF